jgi:predicted Zn-dependent peptidase
MTDKLNKYILKNGMTILGEPMEEIESAAFNFNLPLGVSHIPQGCCGAANVISDWIFRGTENKTSRQLGDALDSLGLHRLSSVDSSHLTVGSAMEASNLYDAVDLYAEIIRKPALENQQFELARKLAMDKIYALNDDPRQKVMLKIKELFYPKPLGRSTAGELQELENLSSEKTTEIFKNQFDISQTIFSIAGKYDFQKVCSQIESLFGDMPKKTYSEPELTERKEKYTHLHNEGAQVHIGIMFNAPKLADEQYYNARTAVSVLSGGMSSRLFTEVREKRGLCYAVAARYHGLKQAAGIFCYAGTTPDKAQQTFDVILSEFERLKQGIGEQELLRAKAGLKSSLILQSESSASRAGSIADDFHLLGRVRTLEEIKKKIQQTTVNSIKKYLDTRKFDDFTVLTIGPKEIKV